jgi:hypothetical protein
MYRLIAAIVLLVAVLHGPALSFAAALGTGGDAASQACSENTLSDGKDCDTCCTRGSMPSCTAQCPVPVGTALPAAFPMMIRVALHGIVIPDVGVAPFADHSPPHLLRPPIV